MKEESGITIVKEQIVSTSEKDSLLYNIYKGESSLSDLTEEEVKSFYELLKKILQPD